MKGAALHKWFWKLMAERIGKRWYDELGMEPTQQWRELLDEFTYEQIKVALKDSPPWDYVPNHGKIAALLRAAARRVPGEGGEEMRRGYWRSAIYSDIHTVGSVLGLWPYGTAFKDYGVVQKFAIVPFARELLNEMDEWEQRLQCRTPEMLAHVTKRTQAFLGHLKQQQQHGSA
jgi:hypothetical protein